MLPVFQPGALLFLGHGHARQGDGGVTGTGVETSLDVEFSVEVVKKQEWPHSSVARPSTVVGEFEMKWPRIESADYLMTVGSGTTLQQALQHATLELHHWLDDDFGLSERAVNIFVGQALDTRSRRLATRRSPSPRRCGRRIYRSRWPHRRPRSFSHTENTELTETGHQGPAGPAKGRPRDGATTPSTRASMMQMALVLGVVAPSPPRFARPAGSASL